VVLQGVLGGLRVTLLKDQIGVLHGVLAQLFLISIFAIVLFTSNWWRQFPDKTPGAVSRGFRFLLAGVTSLIFLQLILGAAMRHEHAGLAVPDFPLAYGQVWPPSDPEFLRKVNRERMDVRDFNPVTAGQIHLHMAHRAGALLILIGVGLAAWQSRRQDAGIFFRGTLVWLGLVLVQGTLGAWTVWSNKAADVATMHVVIGAVILVVGAVLTLISFRYGMGRKQSSGSTAPARFLAGNNEKIGRPLLRPQ
jgi:heme a synthase